MALLVQKYGGTSVADPDRIRACADNVAITRRRGDDVIVVVSAMGGMTDGLLNLVTHAERDDDSYEPELAAIGERYAATAGELLDSIRRAEVLDAWSSDADDVRDVLKAIALVKSAPQRSRDVVAGYGEIWSARLLAAVLGSMDAERGGTWVDARDVITVRQTELGPTVLWDESRQNFDNVVADDRYALQIGGGFGAPVRHIGLLGLDNAALNSDDIVTAEIGEYRRKGP